MTERERDERDLQWLRAHVVKGLSFSGIADRHGGTRNSVAGVKFRVMTADLAESGEPRRLVASYYRKGAWA